LSSLVFVLTGKSFHLHLDNTDADQIRYYRLLCELAIRHEDLHVDQG
jgi:hypothetical protein